MSRATLEELQDRVIALRAVVDPLRKLAAAVRKAMRMRLDKNQPVDPEWARLLEEINAAEHAAGIMDAEQPGAPEPARPTPPPPAAPLQYQQVIPPPGPFQKRPLLGTKTGLLGSSMPALPSRVPLITCMKCSSADVDGETGTVFGSSGIDAKLRCRNCGHRWAQRIQPLPPF